MVRPLRLQAAQRFQMARADFIHVGARRDHAFGPRRLQADQRKARRQMPRKPGVLPGKARGRMHAEQRQAAAAAQMQHFADRLVAQGAYANLSEVVREGMRRLMDERGATAFHALKAELDAAADELERGGGTPFDPRAWGDAAE